MQRLRMRMEIGKNGWDCLRLAMQRKRMRKKCIFGKLYSNGESSEFIMIIICAISSSIIIKRLETSETAAVMRLATDEIKSTLWSLRNERALRMRVEPIPYILFNMDRDG